LLEIYMGYCNNGGSVVSGWRFSSIDIPAGATISKAHLQFKVDSYFTSPLRVLFYGERLINSVTFGTGNMPDNRTLTYSSVPWYVPSTAIWDEYINEIRYGPNLAPIVQEIVNLNGWTPGGDSALTFIVKPNLQYPPPPLAQGRYRRVMAYDRGVDGTHDAHLLIWLGCSTPPCP
jgi:hypothetical protein